MSLNVSRGNMFPWVTHTWNPRAGRCMHGCLYCFMLDRPCDKYRGPPRLEKSEMGYPLGRGRVIFVGSASDLFARDVPDGVIRGGWEPPEHIRVPGVRFAPEVLRSDCCDCRFAPTAHPCVENPLDGSYELLCTRDCLRAGVPMRKIYCGDYFDGYELLGDLHV